MRTSNEVNRRSDSPGPTTNYRLPDLRYLRDRRDLLGYFGVICVAGVVLGGQQGCLGVLMMISDK